MYLIFLASIFVALNFLEINCVDNFETSMVLSENSTHHKGQQKLNDGWSVHTIYLQKNLKIIMTNYKNIHTQVFVPT